MVAHCVGHIDVASTDAGRSFSGMIEFSRLFPVYTTIVGNLNCLFFVRISLSLGACTRPLKKLQHSA